MQIWREVIGYEGLYEVSDSGEVRRVAGPDARGWLRQQRVLRPALNKAGYWSVSLCRDGVMHTDRVHSIVARAFIGPRPNGHEVNHKNGRRTDNRAANLEYVTAAENQQHAVENGLHARGEANGSAILSPDDVRQIRALRQQGVPRAEVARRFGIAHVDYVTRIANGKAWSYLTPE